MRLVFILSIVVGCAGIAAGFGAPPPVLRNMPGDVVGTIHTRWIAPYVSITERQIGGAGNGCVRWFGPDGKMDREISGGIISTDEDGFLEFFRNHIGTIYGINEDWQLTLPRKPGPPGYITGTPDSHFFIHEFHPHQGQITADIYRSGKLTATIGPYIQYRGDDVRLGNDGSMALLAWKNTGNKVPEVIVFHPGGKESFRIDCKNPAMAPAPAPDGSAALVEANDDSHRFSLYAASGKISSLVLGPNARFIAWMPGSTTALMQTSVGHDCRWLLVDWHAGKILWNVLDPNPARPHWSASDSIITRDYVLIAGLEYLSNVPTRSIYALNINNGQIATHWLPNYSGYPIIAPDHFLQLGKHLYLISDSECSEINLEEIARHTGGWK